MNSQEQQANGGDEGALPGASSVAVAASDRDHARSELRRRLLLRGLVGTPVTLAAMRPVQTLAKAKKYCHYSGWHSFKIDAKSSASPSKKQTCKAGKTKTYYKQKVKKLPKKTKKKNKSKSKSGKLQPASYGGGQTYQFPNCNGQLVTLTQSTRFCDLFGSGSTATLYQCFQAGGTCGSYLTAVFNAWNYNSSGYPFTCKQVYAIWNMPTLLGTGVTQDQAALFFQQLDSFS
jgi:hypothetical protein